MKKQFHHAGIMGGAVVRVIIGRNTSLG